MLQNALKKKKKKKKLSSFLGNVWECGSNGVVGAQQNGMNGYSHRLLWVDPPQRMSHLLMCHAYMEDWVDTWLGFKEPVSHEVMDTSCTAS